MGDPYWHRDACKGLQPGPQQPRNAHEGLWVGKKTQFKAQNSRIPSSTHSVTPPKGLEEHVVKTGSWDLERCSSVTEPQGVGGNAFP